MFCHEIWGGLFWGSELWSSFNVFFTLKIVRVALKIPCFFVLDQILVASHHWVARSASPPDATSDRMFKTGQSILAVPAGAWGCFLISFPFLSWQLWRKLEMMKTFWITLSLSLLRVGSYFNAWICHVGSCTRSRAVYRVVINVLAHSVWCCCNQESLGRQQYYAGLGPAGRGLKRTLSFLIGKWYVILLQSINTANHARPVVSSLRCRGQRCLLGCKAIPPGVLALPPRSC